MKTTAHAISAMLPSTCCMATSKDSLYPNKHKHVVYAPPHQGLRCSGFKPTGPAKQG